MITGISIENFKGIRERVYIELRPLTLLFAPTAPERARSCMRSIICGGVRAAQP